MNRKIIVRPATGHQDLDNLAKLFDRYMIFYKRPSDFQKYRTYLEDRIKNREAIILLAFIEGDNNPAGFTLVYDTFSSVFLGKMFILNDLYVLPEYRKQGIAGALIDEVKKTGAGRKIKRITLRTATDNVTAQKLYVNTGFKRDDEFYTYHCPLN